MSRQSSTSTPARTQYVSVLCECGSKGGAYLEHYDVMVCKCGRRFWALRPVQGGPLVAFPHPGTWMEIPFAVRAARAKES